MTRLPLAIPCVLSAAALLTMPANHAWAQRGGRSGGSAHVSSVHVSGGRPGGVGPSHPIAPGGPGHGGRPIRGGNGGGFFGGGFYGGLGGYGYGDYGYGGYGYSAPYYNDYPYSAYPSYYPYDNGLNTYQPGDLSGYSQGQTNAMPLPSDDNQAPARSMPAAVVVIVPTETTELWFNGSKTQTMGLKREFVTPELPPGQVFSYELRARWVVNGMTIEKTRTVSVRAGSQSYADFTVEPREQLPPPGVVPPPGKGGMVPPTIKM